MGYCLRFVIPLAVAMVLTAFTTTGQVGYILTTTTHPAGGIQLTYGPPAYYPPSICPENDPQRNKDIVYKVFAEILGLRRIELLTTYFHTDYIQHNPEVPDGLDALRNYVMGDKSPPEVIVPLRSAADGDLVWTHNKVEYDGKYFASVDIFRFECGKIKEHWDVLQDTALTEPAKNSHPFF